MPWLLTPQAGKLGLRPLALNSQAVPPLQHESAIFSTPLLTLLSALAGWILPGQYFIYKENNLLMNPHKAACFLERLKGD